MGREQHEWNLWGGFAGAPLEDAHGGGGLHGLAADGGGGGVVAAEGGVGCEGEGEAGEMDFGVGDAVGELLRKLVWRCEVGGFGVGGFVVPVEVGGRDWRFVVSS